MSAEADIPPDDTTCLWVESLRLDGRPIAAQVLLYCGTMLAARPDLRRTAEGFRARRALLAEAPPLRARAGFTERVLAARRARSADVPTLARRLAIAAGLVLAVTLALDAIRPAALQAGSARERGRHAVDAFRAHPFAPDAVIEGLRARLLDPGFGAAGTDPR